MKLLLVACLVAVCSAIPPVPNIPQVFCGSGEYRYNHNNIIKKSGKCKRTRPINASYVFYIWTLE